MMMMMMMMMMTSKNVRLGVHLCVCCLFLGVNDGVHVYESQKKVHLCVCVFCNIKIKEKGKRTKKKGDLYHLLYRFL